MADVRGYEEKDPRVLDALRSGYPRFVVHAYVGELIDLFLQREGLVGRSAVLVVTQHAVQDLLEYVNAGAAVGVVAVDDGLQLVHCDASDPDLVHNVRKYVQHVGCGVSSRQAEDLLVRFGRLPEAHVESLVENDAGPEVEGRLAELYGCRETDVWVCSCGMSAFYAGFRAVQAVQCSRGRTHWIQLGWLYLDSGCVLKELLSDGETLEYCYDVNDTDALIEKLASLGETLAAVVVECPTNPLVQICDLKRVSEAVHANGGALIVDPTVASLYNMDVLPYADVLVNSLTKYASYEGDIMIGSLALNAQSPYYRDLLLGISECHVPPYGRDLQRLAYEMRDAPEVVSQMNANASRLAELLRAHPAVGAVYYASASPHYTEVARGAASGGAMVSIELVGSMERFYDKVAVMKGPSFGTRFTLLSPFMYLAHYDLVTEDEGRAFLREVGLDPQLIRISVGTEPYEAIEAVFIEALDYSLL
jgi:cystathionine gamma-synthase